MERGRPRPRLLAFFYGDEPSPLLLAHSLERTLGHGRERGFLCEKRTVAYSTLGSQTRLGLFVRPLLIARSQYSELLKRAACPSRNVNWAPRLWRLVCTKFAGPTAGRFFESNNQTTADNLGMLEILTATLLAP